MKKVFLVLGMLMTFVAFGQDELVPSVENMGGVMFDYSQDEIKNINTDSMKKSDTVNSAMKNEEQQRKKSPKIKFDAKEVQHQRALDFSTNRTNSMQLPVGF